MTDPKCARMMFRAAERDVLTLRSMTAGAPDESFGFHVQQAAEKAFKAWLALLGETYPLTHNLETLLNLLTNRDVATTPIDRQRALALVETLLEHVRRQLAEVRHA